MTDVTTVVDGYIAMWNETDPERRRVLIEQTWTEDGSYVDPHAEVDGRRWPRRARGRRAGAVPRPPLRPRVRPRRRTTTAMRFTWQLVARRRRRAVATGMDVAVVAADGRLRAVTGFLEAA